MHNNILDVLVKNGHSAYIVGGAVRDEIMGKIPHDFDIATSATPAEVARIFPNAEFVGKAFGVTLIQNIEVATFRRDISSASVEFVTDITEDLSRRDFTINAMAKGINGEIIDPFGGRTDAENRIVRFVGDAHQRITEDPTRILRGCRFAATLDAEIAPESLVAMRENAHLLGTIPAERVRKEIMKTLTAEKPSVFFANLRKIHCALFPELDAMDIDGGQHHNETVLEHAMTALDHVPSDMPLVRLAALLHDIGKPAVAENGTFHNHEKVSADIADTFLRKWKFPNNEREIVVELVRHHMAELMSKKSLRRLASAGTDLEGLFYLRLADRAANMAKRAFSEVEICELADAMFSSPQTIFTVNDLAVKAPEIMDTFGLKPGPVIGKIQRHLLNAVLETGDNSRETCLRNIREFLKQ